MSTRTAPTVRPGNWVLLNQSNEQSGSGFETWTKVAAGPGAKFVVVTHVGSQRR